jgi:hypothetical protein
VVSEARKVMIAITATSARPPMESAGTIAVRFPGRGRASRGTGSKGLPDFAVGHHVQS